mmetsp:Transcript_22336/g.21576  ORF Transcript_22336/g.21576 Transcript_22336/m.21576 type:complete len:843 (-) Transcript_22336:1181-3709(-)
MSITGKSSFNDPGKNISNTKTESSRRRFLSQTDTPNSPAEMIEERKNVSLLSLRYKFVCPFAIIVYIILQVVIGLNYIPTQVRFDTTLSLKVKIFNFGSGMALGTNVIQQIMNIFACRELGKNKDLQGIYFSILTVSSIAATASLLTFAINWGGVVNDVFSVYSNAAQWADWLVTVPMMVYIALAIEIKPVLTKNDIIILFVVFFAIVFGFVLNINGIPMELGYFLFAMGCCSLTVTYVLDKFNKVMPYSPSTYDQLFAASQQKVLFRLFYTFFPLFPLTHILAHVRVLDRDNTMLAYAICSVIAKLLFAQYLCQGLSETKDQMEQDIEQHAQEIRNQCDLDMIRVASENDKILREAETKQLRSLMGNVAHDLKTPLHSITADIEALSMLISKIPEHHMRTAEAKIHSPSDSKIDSKSIFDSLDASSQFMAMAINRSQDFMKASNNIALVPAMEIFELQSALMMPLTCIRHLKADRLIIAHPLDSHMHPTILSDKHWISENILCLLSNAVKYSEVGTIDLRITIVDNSEKWCNSSQLSMNQMVHVSVEDAGIGISEEKRNELFQPLEQAQRHAGGTGLGLFSLSKRIEALGGAVGVESRSNDIQGSIFWFTFPYQPCFDTIGDGIRSPEEMEVEGMLYPRRILLIDDSPSVLKVTSRLLKMNSHTVEIAIDGLIGLDRLKEAYDTQDIDMVITDLQMLVMDGIEATSRYRKFEDQQNKLRGESRRLLIVGVSASNDTQSKNDGLDSGMDHFLFKPFAYKDLIHIFRSESLSSSARTSIDGDEVKTGYDSDEAKTSTDGDTFAVRQPSNVKRIYQRSSTHELPSRMETIIEDSIECGTFVHQA